MGSGLSGRKVAVASQNAKDNSKTSADNSDSDSDLCNDDAIDFADADDDFEEKRATKLRNMIAEGLEPGKPLSSAEAKLYLSKADLSSQQYGYRRHIEECMASLEIPVGPRKQ